MFLGSGKKYIRHPISLRTAVERKILIAIAEDCQVAQNVGLSLVVCGNRREMIGLRVQVGKW